MVEIHRSRETMITILKCYMITLLHEVIPCCRQLTSNFRCEAGFSCTQKFFLHTESKHMLPDVAIIIC